MPVAQRAFLARVHRASGAAVVLDLLPDLPMWVKDGAGFFVACNRAFAELVGARDEHAVLGRHDRDYFPPDLCASYARDDVSVLTSRVALTNRVELVRRRKGACAWYSTSKAPVVDVDDRVFAVAGVTRDLGRMSAATERFFQLAPVIEAMLDGYDRPLRIADLARLAHLSVSQFVRRFHREFGLSPSAYLRRIRLDAAADLLGRTDLPISDIALRTGFCDQSHLTRAFRAERGVAPRAYRMTLRADATARS